MFRLVICILVFVTGSSTAWSRDTREMRRHYTGTLRAHLVALDRGLSESQSGQISPARRKELSESFGILKEKLSRVKQSEMEVLLKGLEDPKASKEVLEKRLSEYRRLVLDAFRVVTVPTEIPDVRLGAEIYQENCESCHGASGKGDGKLAQNKRFPMVPAPTDLASLARGEVRSAFSYYNLLIAGLPDSVMPRYDVSLTDQERWSLAFFLMGRAFDAGKLDVWEPSKIWASLTPQEQEHLRKVGGSLAELAQRTDHELLAALANAFPQASAERRATLLLALRRSLAYLSDTPRSRSSM